jgi:hypothetical protein
VKLTSVILPILTHISKGESVDGCKDSSGMSSELRGTIIGSIAIGVLSNGISGSFIINLFLLSGSSFFLDKVLSSFESYADGSEHFLCTYFQLGIFFLLNVSKDWSFFSGHILSQLGVIPRFIGREVSIPVVVKPTFFNIISIEILLNALVYDLFCLSRCAAHKRVDCLGAHLSDICAIGVGL